MAATATTSAPKQLKSHQAYREVLGWIRSGQFLPGDRLPSERDLAQSLQLNHLTVRRGLQRLEKEGVIEKRPNVGNFVAQGKSVVPLALVLPEYLHTAAAAHPMTSLLTAGACSALDPMGYSLSTLFYQSNGLWKDLGPALLNAGVRGILLDPDSSVTPEQVQRLLDNDIQVVLLRDVSTLTSLDLSAVQPDHRMALLHTLIGLAERGHKKVRVAMYQFDPMRDITLTSLRLVLEQTGLGSVEDVVIDMPNPAGMSVTDSCQPIREVLAGDDRPSTIVVPDEFTASELFRVCYELGLHVPTDLSIAAVVDQTPQTHSVPLTAPDSPAVLREVGRIATERLIKLVQGEQIFERHTLLRNQIVWRASVATCGDLVS